MSKAASHAMAEAATSEMSETYAVTHAVVQATHAAMAEAMIEGAVVRVPAHKVRWGSRNSRNPRLAWTRNSDRMPNQPGKCRIGRQPVAIRRMQPWTTQWR